MQPNSFQFFSKLDGNPLPFSFKCFAACAKMGVDADDEMKLFAPGGIRLFDDDLADDEIAEKTITLATALQQTTKTRETP